jgi:uncharacterized protein YndB with AHSA1/START domain
VARVADSPDDGRSDSRSRDIAASPSDVFAAFAEATALMKWLPPPGMTGRALEYDFRPGGRYRLELRYTGEQPDAPGKTTDDADVTQGVFLELLPGRRIEQSVRFDSTDPAFAGEMTMTWTFERTPEGSRVTVTADNVPPGISKSDHDAGLRSSLDQLAAFLGDSSSSD